MLDGNETSKNQQSDRSGNPTGKLPETSIRIKKIENLKRV